MVFFFMDYFIQRYICKRIANDGDLTTKGMGATKICSFRSMEAQSDEMSARVAAMIEEVEANQRYMEEAES